jgi:hypothetical protein
MARDIFRKNTNIDPYERIEGQDENFENLLHNWEDLKGDIILFLGAGASVGSLNVAGEKLPNAYELRNQIWSRFLLTSSERENYDFSNLSLMSLEHASTLAEIKSSRRNLELFVAEKFQIQKSLWQHGMLPFISSKSIFTTNYDNLIEKGFHTINHGKPLNTVFNNTTSINSRFIPLYKPHGTIDHPHSKVSEGGFVITQFDYYEIMDTRQKMLESFISDFQNKCVIFIGYSLLDFDIASILYNLARKNNTQCWYAVFPRNDSDVRNMLRDKFGLRQINKTFFNFVYDLDKAINFIPFEWKFENVNRKLFQ